MTLSDSRVAELRAAHAGARRNGRTLELDEVVLFTAEDSLVSLVLALPSDAEALEGFRAPDA